MKNIKMVAAILLFILVSNIARSQNVDLSPEILTFEPFMWKSKTPGDCPFKPSGMFNGIEFLGLKSGYRYGDTWSPTARIQPIPNGGCGTIAG
jgi:hypothetical protein